MKKVLASTVLTVAVLFSLLAGPASADTLMSRSGNTGNSFVSEPGADCMRNGSSSYLDVRPPRVEGSYSYNAQYVGWRSVIYRWNGSSWGSPAGYGTIVQAVTKPRASAGFTAAQRFTLRSGYYLATVQIFWYHPTTGALDGSAQQRVDGVRSYSVSPIGAVQYNGQTTFCTV